MFKNNIKVYISIINQGWILPQHINWVLPLTKFGIPFQLNYPNKKPATNNRNHDILDFLKTDCTHYLVVDHDVLPDKNPFELIKEDKDVIGLPARVIQKGQLNWVVYNEDKDNPPFYNPVDIRGKEGLLEVDVVGSGCLLVKREVFEKLEAPFARSWNKDGTQAYGTDFMFCRKAKEAGFKIYCAVDYKCEHFKELGLNNISNIKNYG